MVKTVLSRSLAEKGWREIRAAGSGARPVWTWDGEAAWMGEASTVRCP